MSAYTPLWSEEDEARIRLEDLETGVAASEFARGAAGDRSAASEFARAAAGDWLAASEFARAAAGHRSALDEVLESQRRLHELTQPLGWLAEQRRGVLGCSALLGTSRALSAIGHSLSAQSALGFEERFGQIRGLAEQMEAHRDAIGITPLLSAYGERLAHTHGVLEAATRYATASSALSDAVPGLADQVGLPMLSTVREASERALAAANGLTEHARRMEEMLAPSRVALEYARHAALDPRLHDGALTAPTRGLLEPLLDRGPLGAAGGEALGSVASSVLDEAADPHLHREVDLELTGTWWTGPDDARSEGIAPRDDASPILEATEEPDADDEARHGDGVVILCCICRREMPWRADEGLTTDTAVVLVAGPCVGCFRDVLADPDRFLKLVEGRLDEPALKLISGDGTGDGIPRGRLTLVPTGGDRHEDER